MTAARWQAEPVEGPGQPDTPRLAVVTGGSRGIGAATAKALARAGCDVLVGYRERRAAAEEVVADCRAAGRGAEAVQVDVTDEAAVARLFAAAADAPAPLGVVVNNAGVVPPSGRVAELTADRVRRLLDVNVVGAFLVAAAAVRALSTASGGTGGVLINVSSRAAVLGSAGEYVDYAASKAAIDALTTGLATEVAAEGVRVVGVRPGIIDTEIHEPEEVAAAIAWLASDAASYVTGASLDVSGGR